MNRRRLAVLLLASVLGVTGIVLVRHGAKEASAVSTSPGAGAPAAFGVPPPVVPEAAGGGAGVPASSTAELAADGVRVLPGAREMVREFNDLSQPPDRELAVIAEALAEFRRIFGSNPAGGSNAEIVAALRGGNAKRLAVIPPDAPVVNPAGELVDRWGTAFHFHPVSGAVMEVVSAGPDRELWTPDDLGSLHPVDGPVGP